MTLIASRGAAGNRHVAEEHRERLHGGRRPGARTLRAIETCHVWMLDVARVWVHLRVGLSEVEAQSARSFASPRRLVPRDPEKGLAAGTAGTRDDALDADSRARDLLFLDTIRGGGRRKRGIEDPADGRDRLRGIVEHRRALEDRKSVG